VGFDGQRIYRKIPRLLVRGLINHIGVGRICLEGAAGNVPLISLPQHELLPRLFQKEMVRRNLVRKTAMETSSGDSVSIYVPMDSALESGRDARLAGLLHSAVNSDFPRQPPGGSRIQLS
jgi:hypothetical protein